MVCDNAHPMGCGVKHYMCNFPSNAEIEQMTKWYAALEAQRENQVFSWSMETANCRDAVLNTKKCMILNNFYWAVWSIMMLSESDETVPDTFHWEILTGRCNMHLRCVQQFGIGQI